MSSLDGCWYHLRPSGVAIALCTVTICSLGDFLLVYWVKEGSVSVLGVEEVTGNTSVGSESQVKLGRTFHPVRIAAIGKYICTNTGYMCVHVCVSWNLPELNGSFYRYKEGNGGIGGQVFKRRVYTLRSGVYSKCF